MASRQGFKTKFMDSTILFIAEASAAMRPAAVLLAGDLGYRIVSATTDAEAAAMVASGEVDLVLADVETPGFDTVAFLLRLRYTNPDIMRILVVGTIREIALREALARSAAYQYLTKPLQPEQCCLVVRRALETRELSRRHRRLVRELKLSSDSPMLNAAAPRRIDCAGARQEPETTSSVAPLHFEKLVYASRVMAELCDLAREAAQTDLPVLIEGETGTGKELLARGVHFHSRRRTSPLMVQNCGGIRDEVLQSELFGHKRGAFTGAISDRLGLFRAADGGTVFLDEVSEVSPAFQVNLLRFLQEGEVKPLGSDRMFHADVRIIAASNQPLRQLVAAGRFREDLYFRLKGFDLEVPPLRARRDEIPVLAEYFSRKHADLLGHRVRAPSSEVIEIFQSYPFPGNVRELENEMRRMIALAKDGDVLSRRHLSAAFAAWPAKRTDDHRAPEGATLKERVEQLEGELVGRVLAKHHWNQSKAALELGLSRVGLANKIKRYALSEGPSRVE
jgi:two-component system response regulator HupR/HoxA